jgi:hypothetical protein
MIISKLSQYTLDSILQEFAEQGMLVKIRGNCMAPILKNGDSVQVRRQKTYMRGDILAVRLGNGVLVSHRLLGRYRWKGRNHFMTRSDNGDLPDCSVTYGSIMGKVIASGSGQPLPVASPIFRCHLFLSFFYCLCRRIFAKIQCTQGKRYFLRKNLSRREKRFL